MFLARMKVDALAVCVISNENIKELKDKILVGSSATVELIDDQKIQVKLSSKDKPKIVDSKDGKFLVRNIRTGKIELWDRRQFLSKFEKI